MNHNVASWAAIDARLLTLAYEHSMGKIDLRNYLRSIVRRRYELGGEDERAPMLTDADIVTAKRQLAVTLEFDLVPASTPERLERLYAWGLISDTHFGTSMLRLEGFSHADLVGVRPLSDDERALILVGKQPAEASAKSHDTELSKE